VNEPTPPRRILAIEWNPVALLINRLSANLEVVPIDHHALVLSPEYFYARTYATQATPSAAPAPSQRFEGVGGEIGYRYYGGRGGPGGWFAGPSLILAWVQGTVDGAQIPFMDYGVAADAGYQALLADNWVVSLGAGGQYTWTNKALPDQQTPADIYANGGLRPRVLAALGYAF
jgi:hypothetical protein